jgi:beta-glucosidase/6-phospho-beta-glucosidase/beta-galactosidase
VQLYTPVNEMYVCAKFSALYGWWNEQLASHRGFVTALKHIAKANVLAMERILRVRPDALFIQSESSEFFHAWEPDAIVPAERMNSRRFLSLDLNYGRRLDSETFEYVMDNGMTSEEYAFFMENDLKHHCIMGTDYYRANEHHVNADGSTVPAGSVFGYCVIARQYYDRYRLPIMHTETNLAGEAAEHWLQAQWLSVRDLYSGGIPVLGFTWYSLTDQVDWDTALCGQNKRVNPLGLFDLERRIRPVGTAYRRLIEKWRGVLPTESVCLRTPIVMPSEYMARTC